MQWCYRVPAVFREYNTPLYHHRFCGSKSALTVFVVYRREHTRIGFDCRVAVTDPVPLTFSHHRYAPDRDLLLLFYETATIEGAAPRPLEAAELRLLTSTELVALDMPPANAPLKAALERRL